MVFFAKQTLNRSLFKRLDLLGRSMPASDDRILTHMPAARKSVARIRKGAGMFRKNLDFF